MISAIVAILNVWNMFASSSVNVPTSCHYMPSLSGMCETIENCPFYASHNATDHVDHFPSTISTCSSGYICCPNNNLKLLPTPPTCGFDLANHMSNGYETNFYTFRFVVLLRYNMKPAQREKSFLCGGTLISRQYVISAGHCVKSLSIVNYWDLAKIRLGEWNLNENPDCVHTSTCADKFIERGISEVKIHPNYIHRNKYILNDMMLIRFDTPIDYSDFIKPLCLPIFGMPDNSEIFQIAGWGRMKFDGPLSVYKQSGLVKMANSRSCAYALDLHINDFNNSFICTTEYLSEGKTTSPCFGDSGGPLLQTTITKYRGIPHQYLAGIISTGDQYCNSSVTPTLHTNVKYYINWIVDNIRP